MLFFLHCYKSLHFPLQVYPLLPCYIFNSPVNSCGSTATPTAHVAVPLIADFLYLDPIYSSVQGQLTHLSR